MTRRLRLHPRAQSDLTEIWVYTAQQWSLTQADSYLRGLDDTLTLLRDQPDIARRFGSSVPPVRVQRYKSHLVIFTASASTLDVIRIVHARSNWQALLAE